LSLVRQVSPGRRRQYHHRCDHFPKGQGRWRYHRLVARLDNRRWDISITDITIQPTIPTIYSPSLLTVRVTNRVTASRTVTVTLDVNGTPVGTSEVVTATANGDAYAVFSWQPTVTGVVTVTASLTGAPAGGNPDDNTASLNLVTEENCWS
jgi:hypothetical protein